MDAVSVKADLRELIRSNEDALIQGMVHQGQQRFIKQVALSNLTPPSGYYYILVYVTDQREFTRGQTSTVQKPTPQAEYEVQLEVSDEALVQIGDLEAYETMHLDFDRFTDRLVDLIREQSWFGSDPKRKLKRAAGEQDRRVEKSNLSGTFVDTENNSTATLYCQIRFTLVEECVDRSKLYE